MSQPRSRSLTPFSPVAAFFLVLLLFAVLGPAVGGVLFGAVAGALAAWNSTAGPVAALFGYIAFVILALIYAYVLGIAHALVAGVIVAVLGIWRRSNRAAVALLAGAIASVVGTAIAHPFNPDFFRFAAVLFYLPICLVAAWVCWYVTRGIVRATWPNA